MEVEFAQKPDEVKEGVNAAWRLFFGDAHDSHASTAVFDCVCKQPGSCRD